jgi:hypothetical protein
MGRKRPLIFLLCGLLAVTALAGCSSEKKADASEFSAAIAARWFDGQYGLVRTEKLSPPVASRVFGYTGVALYESVVPGMPGYQSLAGQVNGDLAVPPPEKGAVYYWPAVANASLAAVTTAFYGSANSYLAIVSLHDELAEEFKGKAPEDVLARSEAFGRAVGVAVVRWSYGDGYESLRACAYTAPTGPGLWEPTPPGNVANPLQPCWGRLRPFVLSSAGEFLPVPPDAYSTDKNSKMYKLAMEVFDAKQNLTPEQEKIALYWADDPGTTGTPPGHSIAIATQLLREKDMTLDMAAVAYAKVGMAVADGFISCWNTKYVYNLLRPVTYIRRNMDPNWASLINTPPFPEYTSGHSVQSGASAEVLVSVFGDVPFTDRTHVSRGLEARSFSKLSQFADEAAVSRLYGGIHYRPAIDIGVEEGRKIGKKINALKWKR